MMILTEKGLNAVLDSQIKLGLNAGIAIATLGAGIGGSTTAAVGADIVAFSSSRGLFGGVALEGSVMSTDSPADQTYYGQPLGARQLVMQMQGTNQGADPLRDVLTRYGAGGRRHRLMRRGSRPGTRRRIRSISRKGCNRGGRRGCHHSLHPHRRVRGIWRHRPRRRGKGIRRHPVGGGRCSSRIWGRRRSRWERRGPAWRIGARSGWGAIDQAENV